MDPAWVAPFLAALRSGCTVSEAAAHAGASSSAIYARRRDNDDFRQAWEDAMEDSVDLLESEARRRAIDGVEEPVIYQGQLTPVWEYDANGRVVLDDVTDGQTTKKLPRQARNKDGSLKWLTIRKPSDALLALLLKGRRKNVFSDRTELAGVPGAPLVVDETVRSARIAALLAKAKERSDLV